MIIYLGRISQCASCSLPGTKTRRAVSLSLLDLAPDGGCLATDVATRAGGLLHHLFTLALTPPLSQRERGGVRAVCFCGPIRQVTPPRMLSGIVLCGVRTFLVERRDHPANLGLSWYHEVDLRGRQIYAAHVKYAFVKNRFLSQVPEV
jgi:hypothetical protein